LVKLEKGSVSISGLNVDIWAKSGSVGREGGARMLDEGKSITDEVLAAMASTPNLRTLKVLGSAVRHLHDFVRDVDLTETEWATAIEFLTRTGQMCTPQRQEFILLSDVLA
jgi:Catechol dioxygenase N terminus